MKTPNTLHVQLCSVEGCMTPALKTVAYGEYSTHPVGLCTHHKLLDLPGMARKRKDAEERQLLRELGFSV